MAKRMISSLTVSKRKPVKMKRVTKKKPLFKNILDYLKSDIYMFSPLFSSQKFDHIPAKTPSMPTNSTGTEANVDRKEDRKLRRKFEDYMISDCYMYAPLVTPQPCLCASTQSVRIPDTAGRNDSMKQGAETTKEKESRKALDNSGEDEITDSHPGARRTMIRRTYIQQETVKHMIRQNCRPTSVPGRGSSETEPSKVVAR